SLSLLADRVVSRARVTDGRPSVARRPDDGQDCRSERVWGLWTIVRVEAVRFFSAEEVARARSYHRPLYWAAAVDGAIQVGVLAAFVWSGVGNALDPRRPHRCRDRAPPPGTR